MWKPVRVLENPVALIGFPVALTGFSATAGVFPVGMFAEMLFAPLSRLSPERFPAAVFAFVPAFSLFFV